MLVSKLVETPMDPNVKHSVNQGELLSNPKRYCCSVGKLNNHTIACPNISFAVSVMSQYSPSLPQCEVILWIVRNNAHPGRRLLYKANSHLGKHYRFILGKITFK